MLMTRAAHVIRHARLVRPLAVAAAVIGASVMAGAAPPVVTFAARALQPGELVVATIHTAAPADRIAVTAFDHAAPAYRVDDRTWNALIGIDLDVAPGAHAVSIDVTRNTRRPGRAPTRRQAQTLSDASAPRRRGIREPAGLGRSRDRRRRARAGGVVDGIRADAVVDGSVHPPGAAGGQQRVRDAERLQRSAARASRRRRFSESGRNADCRAERRPRRARGESVLHGQHGCDRSRPRALLALRAFVRDRCARGRRRGAQVRSWARSARPDESPGRICTG